jgi:dTDP-glucose 4,6-dehydratase
MDTNNSGRRVIRPLAQPAPQRIECYTSQRMTAADPIADTILVTGGAGFIGSTFVLDAVLHRGQKVVNLDKLTYAGNLDNLDAVSSHPHHLFVRGDIADARLVRELMTAHRPTAIANFAAETHVDRSIDGPGDFIHTNVLGTFQLLEAARDYVGELSPAERAAFRFLHVSTDEVFGSLPERGTFDEECNYAPNSPYAASKAAADHLVRSYARTYGLPTLTSNCCNNYGPFQFPEKLIPLMILNALEGKRLPVYGDGQNVRDWLFVEDHCDALQAILRAGHPGETYMIGARSERSNLALVETLCALLDEAFPCSANESLRAAGNSPRSYRELVSFVADRPGHDRRYAVDPTKVETELGWRPRYRFEDALANTVRWYLEHRAWCDRISRRANARERLGLGGAARHA